MDISTKTKISFLSSSNLYHTIIVNEVPQISKLYNISDDYYFSLNEDPAMITMKIIEKFKRDVETSGIKFYIIYLPLKEYFQDLFEGDELPFDELLKEIKKIALYDTS